MAKKIPSAGTREPWAGGYRRWNGSSWVYYLATRVPRRIEKSTGMHTEELALEHLRAFRANPDSYDAALVRVGRSPLPLTEQLAAEFLDYLAHSPNQGGKGDSKGHCADMKSALAFWVTKLGGLDLRQLRDEHFKEKLDAPALKGRRSKIVAIKSLTAWLRRDRGDGLQQGEGPVLDRYSLPVPQSKGHKKFYADPAEAKRRAEKGQTALAGFSAVVSLFRKRADAASRRDHAAALRAYAAALEVQADCGLHNREIERWLLMGGNLVPLPKGGDKIALLPTFHKKGGVHDYKLSTNGVFAAATLFEWANARKGKLHRGPFGVRKARVFPVPHYEKLVHAACRELGIPEFGPAHLRHAFATANTALGESPTKIAESLGNSARLIEAAYADPAAQLEAGRAALKELIPGQDLVSPLQLVARQKLKRPQMPN